jgi:hypothetical protein
VSSILDALEKAEAAEQLGATGSLRVFTPPRRRRTTVALVIAFAAGAGLTLWLRSVPTAPPPAEERTAPAPVVAAAPAPDAPAEVPPAAVPTAAAPREEPAPASQPAAPGPPAVTAVEIPPPVAASAPPPPAAPAAAPVASAPEPRAIATEAFARPAAAPHVRVSFLAYSRNPERRSATLSVEDGPLVTLHEGESTADLEVARILPDRVELRRAGRKFDVRPRD